MKEIKTIGVDLAKNVFHLVGCNQWGKIVMKKKLKRSQMINFFANLPVCLVGVEACAGSHYWGRELSPLGHNVRLLPAQHVKPYVRGNKNDYNDALAIAEAVVRPEIRGVAIKSVEQQAQQMLHRQRTLAIRGRTALSNQIRGMLAEVGIVLPKGLAVLRRQLPCLLEDAVNALTDLMRQLLAQNQQQLSQLDEHIKDYDKLLKQQSAQHPSCQNLQTLPGFGPVVSSAFFSYVGDGSAFKRGRDVSASLGIVPAQHSTGGKDRLLGISKRGDPYLRSLLIHGARSVVRHAKNKEDHLSRWINQLVARRGVNKATGALANKMARVGWAILRNKTTYQPTAVNAVASI